LENTRVLKRGHFAKLHLTINCEVVDLVADMHLLNYTVSPFEIKLKFPLV